MNVLLTLTLIILSLNTVSAQTLPLELNSVVNGTLQLNQKQTYVLEISSKLNVQQNMFLAANGMTNDPFDTPEISVRKGNSSWKCSKRQHSDICVIEKSNIGVGDQFEIELSCPFECTYSLSVYQERSYFLKFATSYSVRFDAQNIFQGHIKVPTQLNYTSIFLTAFVRQQQSQAGKLNVIADVGMSTTDAPSLEHIRFPGKPIWDQGMGVFLTPEQIKNNTYINILIVAPVNSIVDVTPFYQVDDITSIQVNDKIVDFCKQGSKKQYKMELPDLPDPNYYLTLDIQLYSGKFGIMIKGQGASDTDIRAVSYEGTTTFSISPQIRLQNKIGRVCYVIIESVYDSVYSVMPTLDTRGFRQLTGSISAISQLQNRQVDNYLYEVIGAQNQSLQLTIKTAQLSGKFNYGVRLCSKPQDFYKQCIVHDVSQIYKNLSQYSTFKGVSQKILDVSYFSFTLDYNRCPKDLNGETKVCLLHVIAYRLDNSSQISKYLISILEPGLQLILPQLSVNKYRQLANTQNNYIFYLGSPSSTEQVRFGLTVITGECDLAGSTTVQYPSIKFNKHQQTTDRDSFLVYTDIQQYYFLTVYCTEMSLYNLGVFVKRNSSSSNMYTSSIQLFDGLLQKYLLTKQDDMAVFYAQASNTNTVTFVVQQLRGAVWFEVLPAINGVVEAKASALIPTDNRLVIERTNSEEKSEYYVVVTSKAEAYFSILFTTKDTCQTYPMGEPVRLSITQGKKVCVKFHINSPEDLSIMVGHASSFPKINQLSVNLTIGKYNQELRQRSRFLKKEVIRQICPTLTEVSSTDQKNDCLLVMQISSPTTITFSLLAELSSSSTASGLLDGLTQHINTPISLQTPKHFTFELSNTDSVVVLMEPDSDNLQMIGRLISLKAYADGNLWQNAFPTWNTSDRIQSFYSQSGNSLITIRQEAIKSANCSDQCILLLSVYGDTENEAYHSFNIQVTQSLALLRNDQTKFGYVQKGRTKSYLLSGYSHIQRLVSISSFTEGCFESTLTKLTVSKDQGSSPPIQISTNGVVIIPKQPSQYRLDVNGKQDCFYHITQTHTSKRVYHITEGMYLDLDLKPTEQVYLLYYHSKPESFRAVSMTSTGNISFEAMRVHDNDLKISKLISQTNANYTFGGFAYDGSLKVLSTDSNFKQNSYYMIAVKSQFQAYATLVVHSTSTPIPIKADRMIHDVLYTNQIIKYSYMALDPYNLTISITFGIAKFQVFVNKTKKIGEVTSDYQAHLWLGSVQNSTSKPINPMGTEYIIVVTSMSAQVSYTMQILSTVRANSIKYGIPHHIRLQESQQRCVKFTSLNTPERNTYISFGVQDSRQFFFKIECDTDKSSRYCEDLASSGPLYKSLTTLSTSVFSNGTVYTICMHSPKQINVTLVIHTQSFIFLQQEFPLVLLDSQAHNPAFISLFQSQKDSVVVLQIYECNTQVELLMQNDFTKLVEDANSSEPLLVSRSSGHLIAEVPTKQEGLYFLTVRWKPHNGTKKNITTKNKEEHKYGIVEMTYRNKQIMSRLKQAEPQTKEVRYQRKDGGFTFEISPIHKQAGQLELNQYILYIDTRFDKLKTLAQCQLAVYLMDQLEQQAPEEGFTNYTVGSEGQITFRVPQQELQKIILKNQTFYVTAIAKFSIIPFVGSYTQFYDIAELSNIKRVVQEQTAGLFGILITIFVVLVAVMVCGYLILVKKVISKMRRYILNEEDFVQEQRPPAEKEMSDVVRPKVPVKQTSELNVMQENKAVSEAITHDIQ